MPRGSECPMLWHVHPLWHLCVRGMTASTIPPLAPCCRFRFHQSVPKDPLTRLRPPSPSHLALSYPLLAWWARPPSFRVPSAGRALRARGRGLVSSFFFSFFSPPRTPLLQVLVLFQPPLAPLLLFLFLPPSLPTPTLSLDLDPPGPVSQPRPYPIPHPLPPTFRPNAT